LINQVEKLQNDRTGRTRDR